MSTSPIRDEPTQVAPKLYVALELIHDDIDEFQAEQHGDLTAFRAEQTDDFQSTRNSILALQQAMEKDLDELTLESSKIHADVVSHGAHFDQFTEYVDTNITPSVEQVSAVATRIEGIALRIEQLLTQIESNTRP